MPTIGVSIAVPEPHGSLLREKRAGFGDPMADTVPTHVTLVPPQEVEADAMDGIHAALVAAAAASAPFAMSLRGTGTFRPVSPVVFVVVDEGAEATEQLAGRVRDELGVAAPQFPFHPHVTVAHNLDDDALDRACADLDDFAADFEVAEFALYEHDERDGWLPCRRYPLTGPRD